MTLRQGVFNYQLYIPYFYHYLPVSHEDGTESVKNLETDTVTISSEKITKKENENAPG